MNLGKKGGGFELSFWVVIQLVLVLFIGASFFYFVYDVKNDTLFEKKYVSRDMALMANVVQSVPGDAIVFYSQPKFNISEFSYSFGYNLFEIGAETAAASALYPFYRNLGLRMSDVYNLENPRYLVFGKKGDYFEIKEMYDDEQFKYDVCVQPSTVLRDKDTLFVDVNFEGEYGDNLLRDFRNIADFSRKDLESADVSTDLVIVFDIVENSNENKVEVYYSSVSNPVQSKKMGCLILNYLSYRHLSELNREAKRSDDARITKNPSGMAVLVKIYSKGGISSGVFEKTAVLAGNVYSGVEDYYVR